DPGLRQLVALLQRCDVHLGILNLDGNRLTDSSLVAISELLAASRLPLQEVRMASNRMQGSYGLVHLARGLKVNAKYPLFKAEMNRFTPFVLHLAGNIFEKPMSVTQLLREALGNKLPCLEEDQRFWEVKNDCPLLQLPCFSQQRSTMI
ncbi:unnamed protein product, partial [Polarella glacialis]